MSLPASSVGTWTLDGLSFNTGADSSGNAYLVKSSKGWTDSAPARPVMQERPTADGAFRSSNYRGAKVVELDGIAQCANRAGREALTDALSSLCPDPDTLYPLVRNELGRSLVMYVELNTAIAVVERPGGVNVDFNIQLIASDPRKYSTLVKSAGPAAISQPPTDGTLWEGTPGNTGAEWNGAASPITGTVWQASSGTSGILAMANDGTADAPVLFTVTAPSGGTLQNFSIMEIGGAGRRIVDGGTMAAADVMTIDTATGYAALNGGAVSARFSQFSLITIPRKSTLTVQFSSSSPASGATLLAQWQDTYK